MNNKNIWSLIFTKTSHLKQIKAHILSNNVSQDHLYEKNVQNK